MKRYPSRLAAGLSWLLTGSASACQKPQETALGANASLEEGVVASVADDSIAGATVGRIASAQGLDVRAACDRAIADALFAAEARRALESKPAIRSIETATLARAVLEQLLRDARAQGPARDDEIEPFTRERWVDLDRPSSARTIHAVVVVKQPPDKPRARALANQIAEATRVATKSAEFKKLAEAVPRDNLEVRVEPLPPTTPDGRSFEPNDPSVRQQFDEDFARAANAIAEVGTNSGVVESKFGFHVIHLVERLPEKRVSLEERRRLLSEDVMAKRAALAEQRMLDGLRQATPIQVDRSAVDLMSKLRVTE
jgi:hypothetical protein